MLPPLKALIEEIVISPTVTQTIRDTFPAQAPDKWLGAISELESKLGSIKARRKVKATQELSGILEGLRAKALERLPSFLLSLIRPLRSASTGLSTNLAVLQTSVLLKYQPFYSFLLRESPSLAKQVERGYVNASRAYFETGTRRYTRALSQINTRMVDKPELIGGTEVSTTPEKTSAMYERLRFATLDVDGDDGAVVLAYMADKPELVSYAFMKCPLRSSCAFSACPDRSPVPLIIPRFARQCLCRVHFHRPILRTSFATDQWRWQTTDDFQTPIGC